MGSTVSSTGQEQQEEAFVSLSSLLQATPINWDRVEELIHQQPEQANLYAHGGVEASPLKGALQAHPPRVSIVRALVEAYPDALDENSSSSLVMEYLQSFEDDQAQDVQDTVSVEILAYLLKKRPHWTHQANAHGERPIHVAARLSHLCSVDVLDVLNADHHCRCRCLAGQLPLHKALGVVAGNRRMIPLANLKALASSSSWSTNHQSSYWYARDKQGTTPLDLLLVYLEDLLEQQHQEDIKDENGDEAYLWSLWTYMMEDVILPLQATNQDPLVHVLVSYALGVSHLRQRQRILAARSSSNSSAKDNGDDNDHDYHALIAYALERESSAVYRRDGQGKTLLHVIAAQGPRASAAVSRHVLNAHPSMARMTDAEGRLPLDNAAEAGASAATLEVLVHGEPRAVETRDLRDRQYPFVSAAVGGARRMTTSSSSENDVALLVNNSVSATYFLLRAKPHVLSYFHTP